MPPLNPDPDVRVWTFLNCEYDESEHRLWVEGRLARTGHKTLEVLKRLLRAAPSRRSFEELAQGLWDGDGQIVSLRTAMRQLRTAVGRDTDTGFIESIQLWGYKISPAVRVNFRPASREMDCIFLREGGEIPGNLGWVLKRPLDAVPKNRPHLVWEAQYAGSSQVHVFKFAVTQAGRSALRREYKVEQVLQRYQPQEQGFLPILHHRITTLPCFLEMEHGGISLKEWALGKRQTEGLREADCLALMARLAEIVQVAHQEGVLHNDLKPGNVLISDGPSMGGSQPSLRVRVVDFGSASMLDLRRLSSLQLTAGSLSKSWNAKPAGTDLYLAPEIIDGHPPTRESDVYALGIILLQLMTGNFGQSFGPAWKNQVSDSLVQEIIELSTQENPSKRITAANFSENLRTIDSRREKLRQDNEKAQHEVEKEARRLVDAAEAERLRREDAERKTREASLRPWKRALVGAFVVLVVCVVCFVVWQGRQKRRAQQENIFWTQALVRQSDPSRGDADLTLTQAISRAAPEINTRFADDPEAAASLHETIARALDNRSQFQAAGMQYIQASDAWARAKGAGSERAIEPELERVLMLARSMLPGSLDQAKTLLEKENREIERIHHPSPTLTFFQDDAKGAVDQVSGDPAGALQAFQNAVHAASTHTSVPLDMRITAEDRLCAEKVLNGHPAEAERCDLTLQAEIAHLEGPDSGNSLTSRMRIPMEELLQGHFLAAITASTQAYPFFVKKLGGGNRMTLQLLGTRAAAEASLENWKPAIADDKTIARSILLQSPHSALGLGALSDAALMECRSGETSLGLSDAQQAVSIAAFPGTLPGYAGAAKVTLASCLLLQAQDSTQKNSDIHQATQLLDSADPQAIAAVSGDVTYQASIDLLRAQAALLQKKYADARRFLNQAKPFFQSPGADQYQVRTVQNLEEQLNRIELASTGGGIPRSLLK